ncbi:MAG: DUF3307 domain-containing protein [Planctomycetota bacterium]
MSPSVFVFLLLGHAIGDFAWQSRDLADRKGREFGALMRHGALVGAAHIVALIPLWWLGGSQTWTWAWLLPAIVAAHLLVDAIKGAVDRRRGASLTTFFVDQGLHVACLACAAGWAAPFSALDLWWLRTDALVTKTMYPSPPEHGFLVLRAVIAATAYLLCTLAGSAIVRLVLAGRQPPMPSGQPAQAATDTPADPPADEQAVAQQQQQQQTARMGHTIGVLERALGLSLVLLGAWAGLAGIIAAKSIARFKDLEDRPFGEYFLVGTLTSLLVTVAIGAATTACLATLPS